MATVEMGRARRATAEGPLRIGSWLMGLAAAGFIGYAVIFFIRNFTSSFLELGIGPNEVDVGKTQIQEFSPSLFEYVSHLHIAVSGFIAATGLAVLFLVAFGGVSSGRGSARLPLRYLAWRWRFQPTTRTTSTRSGTSA